MESEGANTVYAQISHTIKGVIKTESTNNKVLYSRGCKLFCYFPSFKFLRYNCVLLPQLIERQKRERNPTGIMKVVSIPKNRQAQTMVAKT